jgi:MFS family permease
MPTSRTQRLHSPWRVIRSLLGRGGAIVSLFLAGSAASYGAFYGLVTEVIAGLPPLREYLGAVSLPLYGIMAFSSLVIGPLSDRCGRRAIFVQGVLAGALGFALVGVVTLLSAPAAWVCWVLVGGGCFALGWCFSSIQTAAMAWIGDAVETERRATAIGVIFIWRDVGVAVASAITVPLVTWGNSWRPAGLGGDSLTLLALGAFLLALAPLGRLLPAAQQ